MRVSCASSPTPAGDSSAISLPGNPQAAAVIWFLGRTIYAQANILAYRDRFLITALVFVAALLPTWLLDRARR